MPEYLYLSLGMFFLLVLDLITIVVVLAHVAYINRVSHRITYQDGQMTLLLDTLSRQNNMLVNIMENR